MTEPRLKCSYSSRRVGALFTVAHSWLRNFHFLSAEFQGAFFGDYSLTCYSYSGLGITEYTEFQFPKERSFIFWKRNTHDGGDLRTTMSSNRKPGDRCERPRWIPAKNFPKERLFCARIPSKPYSFHSVTSAIGSRMNGMISCSFRKRNSSQKNTNTGYSE